jgi:peptidoglycan L-alanyl-D-glutamate endopeptidase CwlK
VLSLLAWVGWRYFVSPVAGANAHVAAPALLVAAGPVSQGRFEGRKRIPAARYWAVATVVLVGGIVVGSVFSMADRIAPDALSALEWERQAHIQGVLNPERLAPPPALPPALFVSSERPALETADRDWSKLDSRFAQPVLQVIARLQSRGYAFALLEGYRSPERQEKLADLGSHVTNARAFQSKHQFGVAADLAPLRDGKLIISERDPWAMEAYIALGEEAEKAGLTWGGRWWFKDYGHVEMAGSIAAIAYGAP